MFKRRIGPNPHVGATGPGGTSAGSGCPDIWELEDGSIAVIGVRKTSVLRSQLPVGAGCGPDEEIVVLPRSLIINAKGDINVL
jgi:hypothetical protein